MSLHAYDTVYGGYKANKELFPEIGLISDVDCIPVFFTLLRSSSTLADAHPIHKL